MVYKKRELKGSEPWPVPKALEKQIKLLEEEQERSTSLDQSIEKGLMEIFPELVPDYEEIAHKSYFGSSFSASVDYRDQVNQLRIEANEVIKGGPARGVMESIAEEIAAAADGIENGISAKEKLEKQIMNTDRKAEQVFLIYSSTDIDSITKSYIESPESGLRKNLAKYKLSKLVIAASCSGMLPSYVYSDVLLHYKTLASSYRRAALTTAQAKAARGMLKDGSIGSMIQEYALGLGGVFNANIEPRLIKGKNVFELASEAYYYEDYNNMVRSAHSYLMKEILAKL